MNITPRIVRQITTRPPTTPPTIAPRFVGSCLEEVEFGSDVELESATELRLEAGAEEVSATVAVGRDAGLVKWLLVELDRVVVASTVCRDGKSLSVRASAPQAMYSKDWSGPLMDSTVEQNCERLLITLSPQEKLYSLKGFD